MPFERAFTGAPWESKVGYCRAIRAGDHGVSSRRQGMAQASRITPRSWCVALFFFGFCLTRESGSRYLNKSGPGPSGGAAEDSRVFSCASGVSGA